MFDEIVMKCLKENILPDIKQQLSDIAKAKCCSQLLIDSLKDQISCFAKMKYNCSEKN